MKKIIYVFLASITLAACGDSTEKDVTTEKVVNPESAKEGGEEKLAAISFEEEIYDFGTITQGEKVTHTYKFTNTGENDLMIVSAKGSCGCTVPKWPKEPIPPGGEGALEVVFDSDGKSGRQHKKVTIVANTHPATSIIAIKGDIVAPE